MKNDIYICEACHATTEVTPAGEVLDPCSCDAPLEIHTEGDFTCCGDCGVGNRCSCYDGPPATREEEIASLRASIADPDTHPIDREAQRHELSILLRS